MKHIDPTVTIRAKTAYKNGTSKVPVIAKPILKEERGVYEDSGELIGFVEVDSLDLPEVLEICGSYYAKCSKKIGE